MLDTLLKLYWLAECEFSPFEIWNKTNKFIRKLYLEGTLMLQYINIVILRGTNQFAVHDISHMKNGHNSRKIISIMWTSTHQWSGVTCIR